MAINTTEGGELKLRFTVSQLAKEFSVTPRALRFYETRGLLAPNRQGANRIYSCRDRARLKLVVAGKRADFTLIEIKEMLDLYDHKDGGAAQRRVVKVKLLEQVQFLEQQIVEKHEAIKELRSLYKEIENIDKTNPVLS